MDFYKQCKDEILAISDGILEHIDRLNQILGGNSSEWAETCRNVQQQLAEQGIRIAVVGAIKSGKSTFINSLLGGDLLKRGAGVVTSIVTRVRSGENQRANLYFKSWDEVNDDIQQAMTFLPVKMDDGSESGFDIRRERDRAGLQDILEQLPSSFLITQDTRNANSLMLSHYLRGYENVKEIVGPENTQKTFGDNDFILHRDFVGEESLAAYLKDIQLEIPSDRLKDGIEVADCQGSDSPNPLHLSMIQDYLLLTHFTIYVVSSRTGLRQADIKFLSIIKKMGILDHIIFVANCDFSEHESLEGLEALVDRIHEELSLIKEDPEIFIFSALYNLLKNHHSGLSERDRLRIEQWESEPGLKELSDRETERFYDYLYQTLTRERYSILLKNHLERMALVLSGIENRIQLTLEMLNRDAAGALEVMEKIRLHQDRMNDIKTLIRSTVGGAVGKLKEDLKAKLDRFFDDRTGNLVADAVQFIRNYHPGYERYIENIDSAGFNSTLYRVFQDFRQTLDGYIAETVNPEIVNFILTLEKTIVNYLESIARPYHIMIIEALDEYGGTLSEFGVHFQTESQRETPSPDIDTLKQSAGLHLPTTRATLRYTARIRTHATLRFGFYAVIKKFKKILKKPITDANEDGLQALKDGTARIKRETEEAVRFMFKDYRENVKFQYIIKLVDSASSGLFKALSDRFQGYLEDLNQTVERVQEQRTDKEKVTEQLNRLSENVRQLVYRLDRVRDRIDNPT